MDFLSCIIRKPITVIRKGGIKVHTQNTLQEKVPKFIWFSPAKTPEKVFKAFTIRKRENSIV
jgi:hypothetical protein